MADSDRICVVDGCANSHVALRYCDNHYRRFKRWGDPSGGRIFLPPLEPGQICSVSGCEAGAGRRGLCDKHYMRWWRHADPEAGRTSPGELLIWLEAHKNHQGDECLIWPFAESDGYGKCVIDGKGMHANRAMCILAHGEPPTPAHHAAHSCGKGESGCVHPDHLRWATPAENEADKLIHGTHTRGSRHGAAKLSEADVLEIRRKASIFSQRVIASQHGISRETVRDIINRKRWAWLE